MSGNQSNLKALIMSITPEDQSEFKLLADTLKDLKDFAVQPRLTSSSTFETGKKKTTFDFVIAPFFNMKGDVSESDFAQFTDAKEYFENYAKAPIFVFVVPQMESLGDFKVLLKGTVDNSELVVIEGNTREARAKAVLEGYKIAKKKYDHLKEKVVTPQFKKYDEDGSGAIDKQELSKLCKDLGQPLDDS